MYRLDLNDQNGQTHQWWWNFQKGQPENCDLEEWLLDQGLDPAFLKDKTSETLIYHLEFVSEKARTMFLLRWS